MKKQKNITNEMRRAFINQADEVNELMMDANENGFLRNDLVPLIFKYNREDEVETDIRKLRLSLFDIIELVEDGQYKASDYFYQIEKGELVSYSLDTVKKMYEDRIDDIISDILDFLDNDLNNIEYCYEYLREELGL